MRFGVGVILLLAGGFCCVLLAASVAFAQATSKAALADYDARIAEELRAEAPEAVPWLEQANTARNQHASEKAVELYRKVLDKAPKFSHARRRLCHELLELGRRDEGLRECRKAAEDGKAANLAGLASALVNPGPGHEATADEIREATSLSEKATEQDPADYFGWYARCQVAAVAGDLVALERASQKVEELAPPDLVGSTLLMRAGMLISGSGEPSPASVAKARELADRAERLLPDQAAAKLISCRVAIAASDLGTLRRCSNELMRMAPEDPNGHAFACILAASEQRWGDARRELARAKELGLDPELAASLEKGLEDAEPFWVAWIWPILWTLGGWFGSMILLVVSGLLLSHLALVAARRLPEEKTGKPVGMAAGLRRAYSAVLWACCVFYYLSIPLVALAVIGIAALVVIGTLMAGYIPIKLLFVIGILVLVTLSAVGKSLLVRPRDEDPGDRLDLEREALFRRVLADVAGKIGTRPVDTVFMTPGTQIAVFERGGLSHQIRGKAERCLILGVGVLEGMKQRELKAILAHEYGHFSNRDTAGGGFALAVRRSLSQFALGLAEGGAASWFNPAWLFLIGFHWVFVRISQGASRLQEVLADRFAAFAYGSEAFVRGLTHVVERSIRFDAHCDAAIKEVIEDGQPLANLYRFTPKKNTNPEAVEDALRQAFEAEPHPSDSHPAVKDRIRWVRALDVADVDEPGASDDAWRLFSDRAALEAQLTAVVRFQLAEQGVMVRPA